MERVSFMVCQLYLNKAIIFKYETFETTCNRLNSESPRQILAEQPKMPIKHLPCAWPLQCVICDLLLMLKATWHRVQEHTLMFVCLFVLSQRSLGSNPRSAITNSVTLVSYFTFMVFFPHYETEISVKPPP